MEPTTDRPVVVLAYDGVAADEAGAITEILTGSGVPVLIASVESKTVTSYNGRLVPTRSVDELNQLHAVVIPGGMGVETAAKNADLLEAIRILADGAEWLGATSTGSVLLTAAGLTKNAKVTTHWLAGDLITSQEGSEGVVLVDEPFVEHGRILTAGGVASTATLAFRLVGAILGLKAEAQARARYEPKGPIDRRYISNRHRRAADPDTRLNADPWWRSLGRKRAVEVPKYELDPTGAAEIVVLELTPDSPD